MKRDITAFAVVLVCFFLSGLAALLYQTVWMRHFSIVFGTSELAVVTVLVAYMGGLALGAAAIGRVIDRLARPVLVYAMLEIGIALSALAVPLGLKWVGDLHAGMMGGLDELPASGAAGKGFFYLAAGFLLLMIPTGFMGATLPLLAKGVVRTREQIGRRVGVLYGINTVGAIFGTLLAAFWLVPALGLRATAGIGVAANVIAGLLGFAVAKGMRRAAGDSAKESEEPEPEPESAPDGEIPGPAWRLQLVLPLMLVSGALSFAYEVLWTRLLGHVVGGSMIAFSTMLASFLAGIALGSMIAARLARTAAGSGKGLAFAELGAGVLSLAVFYLLREIPEWSYLLRKGGTSVLAGNAICSAAVLLPSTLCIGATFPFAVRMLAGDARKAPGIAARVYSWNTVGAIAGAFLAGFYLIPALGFSGMIVAAVLGNFLLAAGAWFLAGGSRGVAIGGLALVGLGAVFFRPGVPWEIVQASPFVSRYAIEKGARSVFYRVGRSATVLVLEVRGELVIRTNGLPEAFISQRGAVETIRRETSWMGTLPVLSRPETKSMLVVGLGGGGIINGIPPQVESVDVIELEKEVVEANRAIAALRLRDPLADPRVRIVVNDARGALALTDKKYDAVVSQPSHPWTAGASHLYTREFFQIVREHLNPGGVFLQWMGASFVDEELFRTLLATVREVFAYQHVYNVDNTLMIVASNEPMQTPAGLQALAGADGSIAGWSGWPGIRYGEDVAGAYLMSAPEAARYSGGAPVSTDDRNHLAAAAARISGNAFTSLASLPPGAWSKHSSFVDSGLVGMMAEDPRWNLPALAFRIEFFQGAGMREAVTARFPFVGKAMTAAGLAGNRGDFPGVIVALQPLLEARPDDREANLLAANAWLRVMPYDGDRESLFAEPSDAGELSEDEKSFRQAAMRLPAEDRRFFEALFASSKGDWRPLREIDAWIERRFDRRHVLFTVANVLRARALIEQPDPSWSPEERVAAARRALVILDGPVSAGFFNFELFEVRAAAAAVAGDIDAFIASVWTLSGPATITPINESEATQREEGRRRLVRLLQQHGALLQGEDDPRVTAFLRELERTGLFPPRP